jgi:Peptidase propeptide and YPEB domain
MRLQSWFSCLGIGTLVLSGMLATGPSISAQDATPPAQAAGQTTTDDDNGRPVLGTPLLEPAIDLRRAQEIALEGQTGAAVMDVELGGQNGVLAYSVLLNSGIEVDVDATTGEVIRTEEQDDERDGDQDEGDEGGKQNNNGDEDEDNHDDDDENGEDES